jgi:hypothetical protein
MPVGATVGTSGKSTEVKTLGGSEATPGVDCCCCGAAAFGTISAIVCVTVGSAPCTKDAKRPTKAGGRPLITTGGKPG